MPEPHEIKMPTVKEQYYAAIEEWVSAGRAEWIGVDYSTGEVSFSLHLPMARVVATEAA